MLDYVQKNNSYIMQNTILITLKTYQKWKKKCPKSLDKKLLGYFILERFSVIDLLVIGRNTTKGCRL